MLLLLLWEEANSSLYIHVRLAGDKYKFTSSKINSNYFGASSEQSACPIPGASTFLMITEWRTCLTWLRQQLTQHIYFL